jgi:3-phenylpropionate/trans-cinnamate dioxygenase ferredoxin subunit
MREVWGHSSGRRCVRFRVGSVDELRREGCRVVTVHGRRIGVLSVDDEFFAVRNKCPHKGAPLCEGTVAGTFVPSGPHEYVYGMENRVLRCPWHGWEFDLTTGRSLFQPDDVKVKVYPVTVEGDEVILHA